MTKFDFSIYHDGLHRPFTKECFAQYGGPRVHFRYWWQFRGRDWVRAHTFCLVGAHLPTEVYSGGKGTLRIARFCHDCGKKFEDWRPHTDDDPYPNSLRRLHGMHSEDD